MVDLARLSRAELEAMAAYGDALRACEAELASAASSVLAEALQGATAVYVWQHYPSTDICDPATHAQYFYHAHPPTERKGGGRNIDEHGHFHLFLRSRGMPPGARPLVMPELAIPDSPAAPKTPVPSAPQSAEGEEPDPWCHLVAIAMNAASRPLRFFTTNRWVTGETWYSAPDVASMFDRFAFGDVPPSPLLNRWVTAMLGLYKPQLAELLVRRDAAVMEWRRRWRPKVHVFEDRRLEVASTLEIDVERQIDAVAAALRRVA